MNYCNAQELLDQRRQGADMPESVVTKALELTGDIAGSYSVADAMREIEHAGVAHD